MTGFQPHLPKQVPIEAYGDGGFRFHGMRQRGSLACLPSGLYGWRPQALAEVTADDLAIVTMDRDRPPFVLFGVGAAVAPLPAEIVAGLAEVGLTAEAMDTGAACRTYNVLLAEARPVAALLLQVP